MHYKLVFAFFGILLLTFSGCSTMTEKRDDPLIGKLVSSKDQGELSYQEFLQHLLKADVIYLGENHDNAEHHRRQLRIINDLIESGKKPRIGFEFFSQDQTGYLMTFVTQQPGGHPELDPKKAEQQLRKNLGWQDRSDTSWQFYYRIIEAADQAGLELFGADLPTGLIQRISRNSVERLTAVEKSLLRTSGFVDEVYRELMFQKLKAAHCGFAREKMLTTMYQTWLERNDAMTAAIVDTYEKNPKEPIVLIVGKGHVEHNMGVFERVAFHLPDIQQVNLGFMEITIKPSPLNDYLAGVTIGTREFPPLHEYVWFTQRSHYEDPCLQFKKMLSRMKEK